MRLGHRVGQYLRGTGVVFKQEQRIVGAGAVAPEAETILADKRRDARLVEQVGIGAGLLQILEH